MTFKEEKLKEYDSYWCEECAKDNEHPEAECAALHKDMSRPFLSQALDEQKAKILGLIKSTRGTFEQMAILDAVHEEITNL